MRATACDWLEAELPGARASFSTRIGGVSGEAFASLNLGILTDDDRDSVAENRRRLAAALGLSPERVAFARQVHGADLATHSTAPQTPLRCSLASYGRTKEQWKLEIPEADGHVVAAPGLAALVFVADCLPVALAGSGGVAMLHCGWRGLAAGILARGVAAVGATDAAIGPGIGPCCYEVGDEVRGAFAGLGAGVAARPDARSGRGRPPAAARGGGRANREGRPLHELRGGARSSPTAATRVAPGVRQASSGSRSPRRGRSERCPA